VDYTRVQDSNRIGLLIDVVFVDSYFVFGENSEHRLSCWDWLRVLQAQFN